MGEMAKIDIQLMSVLVTAMSEAATRLPDDKNKLTTALVDVDVDTSPTQDIGYATNWVEIEIPGLRRRLSLAQSIEASAPSFRPVIELDESKVSNIPPDEAMRQGAHDAEMLKTNDGPADPKIIADINAHKDDPYFAAGFAQNITPTELAAVVINKSKQREELLGYGPDSAMGGKDKRTLDDWKNQYAALLTAVGTTLGTATRNSGELALPLQYSKQWTDAITADPNDPVSGGDIRYGQGAALSLLLTQGAFGTDFLDMVSTGVYEYEIDYQRSHPNSGPIWEPRTNGPSTLTGPHAANGHGIISDPMPGIMSALSHNPDAAQHFFHPVDRYYPNAGMGTVTINGKEVAVDARLKYMIEDRTWSRDIGSDEGAALGAALVAGSTFYQSNDASGHVSATIAAETFAMIGSYTGHGRKKFEWNKEDQFGKRDIHEGWKMWPGMRSSLADMVATYARDLIRFTNPPPKPFSGSWSAHPADELFPPEGPPSAWMDPVAMQTLIQTLGEDNDNMKIIYTGIACAGAESVDYAAQRAMQPQLVDGKVVQSPEQLIEQERIGTIDPVETASIALLRTFRLTVQAGYTGAKHHQEVEERKWEDFKFGVDKVVEKIMDLFGERLGPLREYVAPMVELGLNAMKPEVHDVDSDYKSLTDKYQQELKHLTLDSMLKHGYFDDENYQKAHAHGYTSRRSPSSYRGAVVTSKNGAHFNFEDPAYIEWSDGNEPAGVTFDDVDHK